MPLGNRKAVTVKTVSQETCRWFGVAGRVLGASPMRVRHP